MSIQYHPLVFYMALVAAVELAFWLVAKAAKNPRYYLGHIDWFIYIGVAITVVNWAVKNYMLVFRGVDLLPPWPL